MSSETTRMLMDRIREYRLSKGKEPSMMLYSPEIYEKAKNEHESIMKYPFTSFGIPHAVIDMNKDIVLLDIKIYSNPVMEVLDVVG